MDPADAAIAPAWKSAYNEARPAHGTSLATLSPHTRTPHLLRRIALFVAALLAAIPCTGLCGGPAILSATLPPLHESCDGGAKGFSFDLLEMLLEDAGLTLERSSIQFPPCSRALATAASTPGTLLVGVARTPSREKDFVWVGPFATIKSGLIAKKDRALRVHGDDDLRRLTIAVVRDSAPMHTLHDEHGIPKEAMELVASDRNQFRMLRAGHVDAATHTSLSAPMMLRAIGEDPADYEMIHVLRSVDLYYVLNPADAALGRRLQRALDALADRDGGRFLGALLRAYLSGASIDVVK